MESVIVFGGSLGIGKIIAVYFLEKGCKVTVFARTKNNLESLRDEVEKRGMYVNILSGNVGSIKEVKKGFEKHYKIYGSYPSFIISTAGIQGVLGPAWTLSQDDFEEVIKVNLTGSFNISKTAIEILIKERISGSIILFSGGGSCNSRPNFSSYGVSKTGVLRLVETIADELKSNDHGEIIINAVAPGAVKTRMTEEVLSSKEKSGDKAYEEAFETMESGGTEPGDIIRLVEFLCNREMNKGISGRLIHFRDEYKKFADVHTSAVYSDAGKLRRIKLI